MSKLPRISGRERIRALGQVGFYIKRQESSPVVLRRDDLFIQVVVPDHRELDRGTLRAIVRQAGLGVDEFTSCSEGVRFDMVRVEDGRLVLDPRTVAEGEEKVLLSVATNAVVVRH